MYPVCPWCLVHMVACIKNCIQLLGTRTKNYSDWNGIKCIFLCSRSLVGGSPRMLSITTDIKDLVSLLSASLPLVLAYSLKVTSWSERFYGASSIKSITTDARRKTEWQTEFPSAAFILCIVGTYRPETLKFCLYFTAQKLVCYSF